LASSRGAHEAPPEPAVEDTAVDALTVDEVSEDELELEAIGGAPPSPPAPPVLDVMTTEPQPIACARSMAIGREACFMLDRGDSGVLGAICRTRDGRDTPGLGRWQRRRSVGRRREEGRYREPGEVRLAVLQRGGGPRRQL
jgi:hypothetical protein